MPFMYDQAILQCFEFYACEDQPRKGLKKEKEKVSMVTNQHIILKTQEHTDEAVVLQLLSEEQQGIWKHVIMYSFHPQNLISADFVTFCNTITPPFRYV